MTPFEYALKIRGLVKKHHKRRKDCIGLNAAENIASTLVREIISSDACRRISVRSKGRRIYGGTEHLDEAIDVTCELAKKLFDADYVEIPVTGNIAAFAVLLGLAKPGDTVLSLSSSDNNGGYPLPERLSAAGYGIRVHHFPFNELEMNIDTPVAVDQICKLKPKLIMLGASEFLFPHPVKEVCEAAEDVDANVFYDGAHVLGLIAGGEFQDPFKEGVKILVGGTNKSFPGPHRGIILAKDEEELFDRIVNTLRSPPLLQSTYDLSTTVAVGIAMAEMLEYGKSYARQIIKNSKALARELHSQGIDLLCPHKDFTQSHQVIQKIGDFCSAEAHQVKNKLEAANILVDCVVRYGTSEVTRRGMKEVEMKQIAELVRKVLIDGVDPNKVAGEVTEISRKFQKIHFCFETKDRAYEYFDLTPQTPM